MASALDALPEELLIQIAEHLQGDDTTLRHLALTSQRFQAIAEPVLYRNVFFRTGEQLLRLNQSLDSVSWRVKSLRTINARCQVDLKAPRSAALETLGYLVRVTTNVNEIIMESPWCNNNRWPECEVEHGWSSTMTAWLSPLIAGASFLPGSSPWARQPSLHALKKLTLHLNGAGREFWVASGIWSGIFAHPTVEELHVSSVSVPDAATAALKPGLRTPLKRLTLDEANVTLDGLRGVLSMPRALEYLYIGENRYSPREQRYPRNQKFNRLATRDTEGFTEVLGLQKHSLLTLIYISNEAYLNPPNLLPQQTPDVDLSGFEVLRELSVTGCSYNRMVKWPSSSNAPPRLQYLTVDDLIYLDVVLESGLEPAKTPIFVRDLVAAVPNLKQLNVTGNSDDFNLSAPWMIRPREATASAGILLKQRNCTLRVARPPNRTNIVRPVLYGEKEPEEVLMYINDEQGFRVFVNVEEWIPAEEDDFHDNLRELGVPDDELFATGLEPGGDDDEDDDEGDDESDEDETDEEWEDATEGDETDEDDRDLDRQA